MKDGVDERGSERASGTQVRSIGEDAETVRRGLSDRRVQDAFIAAIDEDPELIKVLARVTPRVESVAADWSCCRGYHPQIEPEDRQLSDEEMADFTQRG